MSEEHRDQLGLWETERDVRRRQAVTWQRMYDEFQASLNTPDRVTEWGMTLRQLICLRCGAPAYYGTIDTNHDLGYCGCPNETDPTWSQYEKKSGWRGVETPEGERRGQLNEDEMQDRWDDDKLPHCECGHSFGLHPHGTGCYLYCGCQGYEANAPMTTH